MIDEASVTETTVKTDDAIEMIEIDVTEIAIKGKYQAIS